jgi:hypothetical protein
VTDVAATGTTGVEARLERRGDFVELRQFEEDLSSPADRRGVIEDARRSVQQHLVEPTRSPRWKKGPAPVTSTHCPTALRMSSTM